MYLGRCIHFSHPVATGLHQVWETFGTLDFCLGTGGCGLNGWVRGADVEVGHLDNRDLIVGVGISLGPVVEDLDIVSAMKAFPRLGGRVGLAAPAFLCELTIPQCHGMMREPSTSSPDLASVNSKAALVGSRLTERHNPHWTDKAMVDGYPSPFGPTQSVLRERATLKNIVGSRLASLLPCFLASCGIGSLVDDGGERLSEARA